MSEYSAYFDTTRFLKSICEMWMEETGHPPPKLTIGLLTYLDLLGECDTIPMLTLDQAMAAAKRIREHQKKGKLVFQGVPLEVESEE